MIVITRPRTYMSRQKNPPLPKLDWIQKKDWGLLGAVALDFLSEELWRCYNHTGGHDKQNHIILSPPVTLIKAVLFWVWKKKTKKSRFRVHRTRLWCNSCARDWLVLPNNTHTLVSTTTLALTLENTLNNRSVACIRSYRTKLLI